MEEYSEVAAAQEHANAVAMVTISNETEEEEFCAESLWLLQVETERPKHKQAPCCQICAPCCCCCGVMVDSVEFYTNKRNELHGKITAARTSELEGLPFAFVTFKNLTTTYHGTSFVFFLSSVGDLGLNALQSSCLQSAGNQSRDLPRAARPRDP